MKIRKTLHTGTRIHFRGNRRSQECSLDELTRHGQPIGEHSQVVVLWVRKKARLDDRRLHWVLTAHTHTPARTRRHVERAHHELPLTRLGLIEVREHVEIKSTPAPGAARAQDDLALIERPTAIVLVHRVPRGLSRGESERDPRMIVKILAEAGRVDRDGDSDIGQMLARADAGPHENRRRSVCTCGHDEHLGRQLDLACFAATDEPGGALLVNQQAVCMGVVVDGEGWEFSDGIQEGERRVPARVVKDVRVEGGDPLRGVGQTEIRQTGKPSGFSSLQKCSLPR